MSTVPVRRYTPEEYLALERAAEHKSEYYRGEIFAMAGAREPHNRLVSNLVRHLGNSLEGRSCSVYPSDMRVKCPTGLYTYPDVVIVCEKPKLEDDYGDNLLNPLAIFEILSPSTEAYDRGKKFEHYRSLSSLREYVLVSQDRAAIERFVRPNGTGDWTWVVLTELDDTLTLNSCGATVRLKDIYAGIEFPPPTIADVLPLNRAPR
jgi:Uma2 family endonuclease